MEVLAGVRARSASAGAEHSLVATEGGALYSFGPGADGRLGHGGVGSERWPKMVDALRHVRIAAAAAGSRHSLALAEDGTVFSWGGNDGCQLGLGCSGGDEPLLHRVEALSGHTVRSVAAGHTTSCALTAAGELFTWGRGRAGKLGHGDPVDQLAPRHVEVLHGEWVVAVSASLSHTVAATREGGVFGWEEEEALGLPAC